MYLRLVAILCRSLALFPIQMSLFLVLGKELIGAKEKLWRIKLES